jgi:hypothetical protein
MPFQAVTLATLISRLQSKWDGGVVSMPFWSNAEAIFAINEALQWYNLYTGIWKQRVVITTIANQVYYATPTPLIYNARLEFNGQSLAQSYLSDIDNGHYTWEGETTDTVGVPSAPQVWLPIGLQLFALWPTDAIGNNSILIDGVMNTPTLTLPTDTVNLDNSEIDALLGEALYISTFKDPGRSPRSAQWHADFTNTVQAHNGRLKAANAFRSAGGTDLNAQTQPLSDDN